MLTNLNEFRSPYVFHRSQSFLFGQSITLFFIFGWTIFQSSKTKYHHQCPIRL